MSRPGETPWIKAADGSGEHRFGFFCERCGAELPIGTPVGLVSYVDAGKAFIAKHSACRLPDVPPQFDNHDEDKLPPETA